MTKVISFYSISLAYKKQIVGAHTKHTRSNYSNKYTPGIVIITALPQLKKKVPTMTF